MYNVCSANLRNIFDSTNNKAAQESCGDGQEKNSFSAI